MSAEYLLDLGVVVATAIVIAADLSRTPLPFVGIGMGLEIDTFVRGVFIVVVDDDRFLLPPMIVSPPPLLIVGLTGDEGRDKSLEFDVTVFIAVDVVALGKPETVKGSCKTTAATSTRNKVLTVVNFVDFLLECIFIWIFIETK